MKSSHYNFTSQSITIPKFEAQSLLSSLFFSSEMTSGPSLPILTELQGFQLMGGLNRDVFLSPWSSSRKS